VTARVSSSPARKSTRQRRTGKASSRKSGKDRGQGTSVYCVASATAVDNYSLDKLTINKLSDDVLLCIFVSYRRISEKRDGTWPWHKLAHICGRWRNLVFGRAGHLNLQLACKSKTDVNTALDIWPALPIVIDADFGRSA